MELETDKAFNDLMQAILARYHEEQVWSDKIRSMSTWVGLAGLVVNLVVFLGAVVFVEPWKRRRLVAGIEERMGEMMSKVEGEIGRLAAASEAAALEGSGTLQAESTMKVGTSLEAASTAAMLALNDEETKSVIPPTSAPFTPTPTPTHIDQALEYASPLLDRIAPASRDRDILFSAGCGVVLGITTMAISMLFR
jgi:sensitive to high expression protein 9